MADVLILWSSQETEGHGQRRNQYEAVFTIKPVDGVWKIAEIELVSEERL